MYDLGIDGLTREPTLDKNDASVDASDRHPTVAELGIEGDLQAQGRSAWRSSAETRCGFARPLDRFMTWPTRNPRACSFPPR